MDNIGCTIVNIFMGKKICFGFLEVPRIYPEFFISFLNFPIFGHFFFFWGGGGAHGPPGCPGKKNACAGSLELTLIFSEFS